MNKYCFYRKIKTLLSVLLIACLFVFCNKSSEGQVPDPTPQHKTKPLSFLKEELNKPRSNYVMVVAHRGYWRQAPENSIAGITKAMELGADVVEVDIRKTKDNILVLMHDETLNRTTTGTGKVADKTYEELQTLFLKAHGGQVTSHKIPTLEEAMNVAKGKILVNIDKADGLFEEVGEVLRKTGTLDIAMVKSGLTVPNIRPIMPHIEGSPFMAVISLDKNAAPLKKLDDYVNEYGTRVMEISFQKDTSSFFNQFEDVLDKNVKIWMTPCSSEFCAGRHDARALSGDKDGSWGWLLDHGATMLLTDRPKELIEYLESIGRRN